MVPLLRRDRKRVQQILEEIEDGGTTKMAAEIGGVARRTLYEWVYKAQEIRDARMDDPMSSVTPYDDDYIWFLREYEKARHARKKKLLKRIEKAGEKGKWQADAWLLGHYDPEDFGRGQVAATTHTGNEVFTFNIATKPRHMRIEEGIEEEIKDAEFEIVDSDDNS